MEHLRSTSPVWLSHHWPEHYDRCVAVGRIHVCRRCLVLYPLVVGSAVVAGAVGASGRSAAPTLWLMAVWLLPLPLVIDWVGEHLGRIQHSPTRQIVVTAVAAPAFGLALARHLDRPFDPGAIVPVALFCSVCVSVAVWAWWKRSADAAANWEQDHVQREEERSEALRRLLAEADARLELQQRPLGGTD